MFKHAKEDSPTLRELVVLLRQLIKLADAHIELFEGAIALGGELFEQLVLFDDCGVLRGDGGVVIFDGAGAFAQGGLGCSEVGFGLDQILIS